MLNGEFQQMNNTDSLYSSCIHYERTSSIQIFDPDSSSSSVAVSQTNGQNVRYQLGNEENRDFYAQFRLTFFVF